MHSNFAKNKWKNVLKIYNDDGSQHLSLAEQLVTHGKRFT